MLSPRATVISSRYLSEDERVTIADLHRAGLSSRVIAEQVGRSPSTVSRELGLERQHGAAELTRAVLEGVAFDRRVGRAGAPPQHRRGGHSLGAAVTLGVGLGLLVDVGVARGLSEVTARSEPDDKAHAEYRELHGEFLDAYRNLEPWFARRAARRGPS